MEIHGFCEEGFDAVRAAFVGNFERGEELGAAVAVTHRGRPVVDLWAGDADPAGRPWDRDTIVNVYSITKTMTFVCVLMLIDRGLLDPEDTVASHWPEFAARGKDGITVAQVLSHTAGLSGFDPAIAPEDLYDWDRVCAGLAAQAPWWTPGEGSGYHLITQGFLLGEVVRRITGMSVGTFFAAEVAGPLDVDFHFSLPETDDDRVAELIPPDFASLTATAPRDPDSIALRSVLSCPLDATEPQTRAWRAAEIPAAGGIGNARAVARVHAALACGGTLDGVRLMSPETVESIVQERSASVDRVLGMTTRFGLGYGLMTPQVPLSPNPRAFYWGGWGGSIVVTDLDTATSVAYVMNRMGDGVAGDLRGGMVAIAATDAASRLVAERS